MLVLPQWEWGVVDTVETREEEFVVIPSPAAFAAYLGAKMLEGPSDHWPFRLSRLKAWVPEHLRKLVASDLSCSVRDATYFLPWSPSRRKPVGEGSGAGA